MNKFPKNKIPPSGRRKPWLKIFRKINISATCYLRQQNGVSRCNHRRYATLFFWKNRVKTKISFGNPFPYIHTHLISLNRIQTFSLLARTVCISVVMKDYLTLDLYRTKTYKQPQSCNTWFIPRLCFVFFSITSQLSREISSIKKWDAQGPVTMLRHCFALFKRLHRHSVTLSLMRNIYIVCKGGENNNVSAQHSVSLYLIILFFNNEWYIH